MQIWLLAKKSGRGLGGIYDIHGLNQVGENACLTTAVTKFLPDLATQLDVKSLYHLYLMAYIYTSAITSEDGLLVPYGTPRYVSERGVGLKHCITSE